MKLNFWQWMGVVLLVVGGSYWYYGHYVRTPDTSSNTTSATPQAVPATGHAP